MLDTHIFLWFISGDPKLPIHLQSIIRNLNNNVYLSCVSVWEATVKYQLGKLPLPESPDIYLPKQQLYLLYHFLLKFLSKSDLATSREYYFFVFVYTILINFRLRYYSHKFNYSVIHGL